MSTKLTDDEKSKISKDAVEFEKQYGTQTFLKVALSSITRLLVDKQLVNEDDLLISFERQKKEYGEKCTDPLVDMLSSDEPLDIDALEKMAIQTNKCLNVFFVKERNNK